MKYYKSLFSDNQGSEFMFFLVQDATEKAGSWEVGRNIQSFEGLLFY